MDIIARLTIRTRRLRLWAIDGCWRWRETTSTTASATAPTADCRRGSRSERSAARCRTIVVLWILAARAVELVIVWASLLLIVITITTGVHGMRGALITTSTASATASLRYRRSERRRDARLIGLRRCLKRRRALVTARLITTGVAIVRDTARRWLGRLVLSRCRGYETTRRRLICL